MNLRIDGLVPTEALLILTSAASQIAAKDLPPIIAEIKKQMDFKKPLVAAVNGKKK